MELNLQDVLSLMPFLIQMYYFCLIFYYKDRERNLKVFIGMLSSAFIAQFMKYTISYPKYLYKYIMRPPDACNCNYLSNNGSISLNTPGFPSGHMATTAFFVLYNIETLKNNYLLITLNTVYFFMMGWARIVKKCHNIYQVIGGSLLGGLIYKLIPKILY